MDAGRETLFITLQHNIVLFWVIWWEVFFFNIDFLKIIFIYLAVPSLHCHM